MNFHIMTLFPEMVENGLNTSIIGKATKQGNITIEAHNIRDFTQDKHKKVDDYPYGGGAGMLIQAQPVYDCYVAVKEKIAKVSEKAPRVLYMTPQGKTFSQDMAKELAKEENLVFLCGHYEGIDERVLEEIVTDYVSIGDYVLTGGELPAMVMIDSISRLVDGVLNNEESAQTESFHNYLLEYPQYSRPEVWKEKEVPDVLLSGNHKSIEAWRLEQSKKRTKARRPDLYKKYKKLKECEQFLLKDKLLHMDMLELLRSGEADIVYFGKDGVLLREKQNGLYMLTASDRENGEQMLALIKDTPTRFVSHQEFMNDAICGMFGLEKETECLQSVYTRKEPLPLKKGTDIRRLDVTYLDEVCEHYHLIADRSYVEERLKKGVMYGAFEGDTLVGFVGTHQEGAIGMLEVFEAYRNKGYGKVLASFCINQLLKQGKTPYCQIICGNDTPVHMQKSLNMYVAKKNVYWLTK